MSNKNTLINNLNYILSIKRPHSSESVKKVTEWIFNQIPKKLKNKSFFDDFGNLHIDNRQNKKINKTLFIGHVDTVHKIGGVNKIKKTTTNWLANGDPLGADDGAGCTLLIHLIKNNIKGYYIFSQGEECGGLGAKFIVKNYSFLLSEFDCAIAFDRKGVDSVISYQGVRCASDRFCENLSSVLNSTNSDFMYSKDDSGIYTDTAEFVHIIPECTNISVGYDHEHSDKENLNIVHFKNLAAGILLINWDNLTIERDPKLIENKYFPSNWLESYPIDNYVNPLNYTESELLRESIFDALSGNKESLIDFIAYKVYPVDCNFASDFLNPDFLTEDILEDILELSYFEDVSVILFQLYDLVYCERY